MGGSSLVDGRAVINAIIDHATSGNNTLKAAETGKQIVVHQLFLVAAGTVTVRFEDGADGTALSGQMTLAVNNVLVLPFSPAGWFRTSKGVLLNMELSGAVSVDGAFGYSLVD